MSVSTYIVTMDFVCFIILLVLNMLWNKSEYHENTTPIKPVMKKNKRFI